MQRSRELLERARLAGGEASRCEREMKERGAALAELGFSPKAIDYTLGIWWGPQLRGMQRRAKWWRDRGLALERPYLARVDECEVEGAAARVELMCRAEGTVRTVPARCGQNRWCDPCAARRRGGWYKRAKRGLANRHREALAAWSRAGRPRGMRPDVELVTLGVGRPEAGIKRRKEQTEKGWRRLRAWLYVQDKAALPFVAVNELTRGADEMGHPHKHVAVVWPWRNLRKLDEAWVRATDGWSNNVDVQGSVRAKHARVRGLSASVSYLAAYVAKGGSSTGDLTLDAEWHELHARGARLTSCSRGALAPPELVPTCPECGGFELVVGVKHVTDQRYECRPAPKPVRLDAALAPAS